MPVRIDVHAESRRTIVVDVGRTGGRLAVGPGEVDADGHVEAVDIGQVVVVLSCAGKGKLGWETYEHLSLVPLVLRGTIRIVDLPRVAGGTPVPPLNSCQLRSLEKGDHGDVPSQAAPTTVAAETLQRTRAVGGAPCASPDTPSRPVIRHAKRSRLPRVELPPGRLGRDVCAAREQGGPHGGRARVDDCDLPRVDEQGGGMEENGKEGISEHVGRAWRCGSLCKFAGLQVLGV